MTRKTYRYRSAVTGRYVTPAYAAAHPREVVRERVVPPKEKPPCSS